MAEPVIETRKPSIIEIALLKLRLWCLLVLPIFGFLIGRLGRLLFGNAMASPILVHLITMAYMIAILNEVTTAQQRRDPNETMVFTVLGYLFVLGSLVGLVVE